MKTPARRLALWIIEGVVFLLVSIGIFGKPPSSDPGTSRPDPD